MLTALALAVAAPAAEEIVLPEGEALAAAVAARDAEFFAFEGCDPDGLQDMLAADFEMYPDRGAVVATAAEPFVREYREACVARRTADAWRSRRELVAASLNVHPVPGYGAIEDGERVVRRRVDRSPRAICAMLGVWRTRPPHGTFYKRQGDGPERLAGRARAPGSRVTLLPGPGGLNPSCARSARCRQSPSG